MIDDKILQALLTNNGKIRAKKSELDALYAEDDRLKAEASVETAGALHSRILIDAVAGLPDQAPKWAWKSFSPFTIAEYKKSNGWRDYVASYFVAHPNSSVNESFADFWTAPYAQLPDDVKRNVTRKEMFDAIKDAADQRAGKDNRPQFTGGILTRTAVGVKPVRFKSSKQ